MWYPTILHIHIVAVYGRTFFKLEHDGAVKKETTFLVFGLNEESRP